MSLPHPTDPPVLSPAWTWLSDLRKVQNLTVGIAAPGSLANSVGKKGPPAPRSGLALGSPKPSAYPLGERRLGYAARCQSLPRRDGRSVVSLELEAVHVQEGEAHAKRRALVAVDKRMVLRQTKGVGSREVYDVRCSTISEQIDRSRHCAFKEPLISHAGRTAVLGNLQSVDREGIARRDPDRLVHGSLLRKGCEHVPMLLCDALRRGHDPLVARLFASPIGRLGRLSVTRRRRIPINGKVPVVQVLALNHRLILLPLAVPQYRRDRPEQEASRTVFALRPG